ncbi:hypothetical protein SAMN05661093_11202 [Kibdelosporangium aridum]|uniref:Uncharacterized protein n=1 Tax=Kibdelosporangium aridum TaxID=2030 RepID=A0A1Y5YE32_KIBAR|nr:hypothetical protein SAMN05661093_11202 [Kibdelosporangium aridum]
MANAAAFYIRHISEKTSLLNRNLCFAICWLSVRAIVDIIPEKRGFRTVS